MVYHCFHPYPVLFAPFQKFQSLLFFCLQWAELSVSLLGSRFDRVRAMDDVADVLVVILVAGG